MKTDYEGIDYGLGKSNVDDNGIRYGVIHHGEVGQAWYDESESYYDLDCLNCGENWGNEFHEVCPNCEVNVDEMENRIMNYDMIEPVSFYFKDSEYYAEQTADDTDIFIMKSPYFTYAQFCSPCAPGAGYLMNELDHATERNKTYCFGHDWFESGKAPYTVYDVKTGKVVKP